MNVNVNRAGSFGTSAAATPEEEEDNDKDGREDIEVYCKALAKEDDNDGDGRRDEHSMHDLLQSFSAGSIKAR